MSETAKTSRNGADPAEVVFPLDSFREAATHLRRPFTPAAVKFKVQATWPTGGLIVAYIDARLVVERLNLIVPDRWADEYQTIGSGLMWCHLTVDGITRKDVGEGQGKGLVSDALKRAAVKFGVGVSLYAIPKMMLNVSDGHLKPRKDTLELTPSGETHVRNLYAAWLDVHGRQAFGGPLDHGDSEQAQGDTEVEPPDPEEPAPKPHNLASEGQQRLIYARAQNIPPSVLANIVKEAAGAEPTLFDTESDAEDWLRRALPKLPANLVNPVVEALAKEGAIA